MTISDHAAAAAKAIRTELKKNNIAARVTCTAYSGGGSVSVFTADLPPHTVDAITTFAKQYQQGHFNGMEDIYEYSNNNDDLPQVKFVFIINEYSQETKQAAWDELRERLQGMDRYPADINDVHEYDATSRLYRYMNGSQDFMYSAFRKPRIKQAA
ncbi:MAG: hypothetical protein GY820_36380 [Gammaproteobacteria bacterium]|nr:hypothetical protein [Gammaproteobacteria bacterium]